MQFPKSVNIGMPLLLFLILLFIILTDTFYLKDVLPTSIIDRTLFLVIHISFWFTTAFLFNSIVNKFYWGGINKVPVGNFLLGRIKDFLAALAYAIVTILVLVKYFGYEQSFDLFAAGLIAIFLGMLIRPHLLCFFRSVFFSNSIAFNIGDWIKLNAINSNTELVGEVINVDRRNLKIKTENNNVVTIPQKSLVDFVIENYWGSGKEARFEVDLIFDFGIPAKRVKRILLAAAKQAIDEYDLLAMPKPEVFIDKLTASGVCYKVNFWIVPWESISPQDAKDKILSKTLDYVNRSGLSFTKVENKTNRLDINSYQEVSNIISKIELFDSLNENELENVAKHIHIKEFSIDEVVITENDDGDSMFIVVEGLLDVFVTSTNNYQLKVGRLAPGDFFGEMSLMTGEKRSATVKAATDVLLFEIIKESVSEVIQKREEVIKEFGESISRRTELNIHEKEEYEKSQRTFLDEIMSKIKRFFKQT